MSKIFISHASEDKEAVAVPLAERLKERRLDVWLDQWELALGDGLRSSIETALSQAPFGIVILSPSYMSKKWPNRELDGLFSLETKDRKVILPVLHNIRLDELTQNLPMMSDRICVSTDKGLDIVADQIATAVQKTTTSRPEWQPPEAVLSGYRRRMLSAASVRDLKRVHFELDDFLRQYPAHPQARLLKDDINTAIYQMNRRKDSRKYHKPSIGPPKSLYRKSSIWRMIGWLLGLLGMAYLIYKIIR